MIYIIGDRHGEEDGFSEQKLPGQSLWTSDDTVIVCYNDLKYPDKNGVPTKAAFVRKITV